MSFIREQHLKMSEFYSEKVQSKSSGGKELASSHCKSFTRRKFKVKAVGAKGSALTPLQEGKVMRGMY